MLKVASVILIVNLLIVGCIIAFRNRSHQGQRHQPITVVKPVPPDPDGSGTNYMRSPDIIVVDGQDVDISPYSKNFRQRARALLAAVKASEEEMQIAERNIERANIELALAMSEVEMLQQTLREADSRYRMAVQRRDAEWEAWRAKSRLYQQNSGDFDAMGGNSAVFAPGPPPTQFDDAVRNAEQELKHAKQRYELQYTQANRRIEVARLSVRNNQNSIASARAAMERAKADLFDMLNLEMPK